MSGEGLGFIVATHGMGKAVWGLPGSVASLLSLETVHQFTWFCDLPACLRKQNESDLTDCSLEVSPAGEAERQG